MSEFPTIPASRYSSALEKLSHSSKDQTSNKNSFLEISNGKNDQTLNESDEGSISLDIKLGELSSSSSLSWSDEYESDITKKIHEKLKRMDRVLKGEEPLPSHYDKEEFEQWMQTFPNISIFDKRTCNNDEPVLSGYSSSRKLKTNKAHHQKDPSVINIPEFSNNRLLSQRSASNRKRHFEDLNSRNKNVFTISSKPKSLDTDKFLKIASIRKTTERNLSTKSLREQQNSKDYADLPQHFDSLPFIEIDEIFNENRKLTNNFRSKKYLNLQSNLGKTTELLILPPIQGDKPRSISATPSQDKPSNFFML